VSSKHSALAVLVAVVWGVNFVVIDEGLAGVPPLLLVAIRFTLVALPLVFFVPRPTSGWRTVVAVGAFMSLGQFSLLYVGMHLGMPAGLASLVLQVQVVFTMVIARAALGERSTRRQIVGALVGTAGLAIVAVAHGVRAPVVPLLITVGAGLSWAIGNVVSRRARVSSGLSLVVWSALVVPVPAFLLSLVLDGPGAVSQTLEHLPLAAILSTLYTVFGASLLGYVVWNSLLARYPAGAVVPYVLLVPPVGILAAWLAEGESPAGLELIGGLVMLSGVAAATISRRPGGKQPARSSGGGGHPAVEHVGGQAVVDTAPGQYERGAHPLDEGGAGLADSGSDQGSGGVEQHRVADRAGSTR
jgi:O-acetylserine/cysteine efflux transporter